MSKDNIFKTREESLETLINNKKYYSIPDFQRSYTWDKNSVIGMIESISESKLDSELYLGTIFHYIEGDKIEITDGQQRLITLYLILNSIRIIKQDDTIENLLYDEVDKSYIEIYESTPIHQKIFKIKQISEINQLNDSIGPLTLTKLQIIKNQEIIYDYILNNQEMIPRFLKGLKHTRLIFIEIPSEKNIHRIFRNINSKGTPLNNIDIIKNAFFERIDYKKGISFEQQLKYTQWKEIENKLLQDKLTLKSELSKARKKLESGLTLILYWFASFYSDKRISNGKFYLAEEYEKLLIEGESDKNIEILKELVKFSESSRYVLYPIMNIPNTKLLELVHPYLQMLEKLNFKQHRPIFLSLYSKIMNQNKFQGSDEMLIEFCNRFYVYQFVFTAIISDRGSKIGQRYNNQAREIYINNKVLNFDIVKDYQQNNFYEYEYIKSAINDKLFYVKSNRVTPEDFKNMSKSYKVDNSKDVINDFMVFLEYSLRNEPTIISGIKIESIEHIYGSDINYDDLDNYKLMSFLPLESKINSACDIKSLDDKIKYYKKSKYLTTKKFVELYEKNKPKTDKKMREIWLEFIYNQLIKYI